MLIRFAREDDLKACAKLDLSYETEIAWQMEEAQGSNLMGATFREVRLPRKQRVEHPMAATEDLEKVWATRDAFWVAAERRQAVGFLGLELAPVQRQAYIIDLGVTAEFRRQGVATKLLQHAAEWCLRHPVDQLVLACPLKGQPAISFALTHHFTFCGFQDAYWPGQDVALFFRQRLRR